MIDEVTFLRSVFLVFECMTAAWWYLISSAREHVGVFSSHSIGSRVCLAKLSPKRDLYLNQRCCGPVQRVLDENQEPDHREDNMDTTHTV